MIDLIPFQKYHGTGNDFLFIPEVLTPSEVAKKLCDRHMGIGADGLMIAMPSKVADIRMDYWNSDGSIAPMCGNGMRCFVKYVLSSKRITKPSFIVETLAGLIAVQYHQQTDTVSITMTKPILELQTSDVLQPGLVKNKHFEWDNQVALVSCVFLGTLHAVVVVEPQQTPLFTRFAEYVGSHPFFPKGINVNLVEVLNKSTIQVTTFERGAGWTLSCGTGASASAYLTHIDGLTDASVDVIVPGGRLHVRVDEDVILSGKATFVASGVASLD